MMSIKTYTAESLLAKIPDLSHKKMLDVGTGHYSRYARACLSLLYGKEAENYRELEKLVEKDPRGFKSNITAIDADYREVPKNFLPHASVNADARALPFYDGSFGIVAMGRLMDLQPRTDRSEVENAVGEAARVLRPEGYLVGDTPIHPMERGERMMLPFNLIFDAPAYRRQLDLYQETIENAGFEFAIRSIGFGTYSYWEERLFAFHFLAQKR